MSSIKCFALARLVLGAVCLAALAGPAEAQKKKPKEIPVGVDAVRFEPLMQTFPVLGRLVARQAGVVAARIGGPVGRLHADVGDRVKKGAVIATLVNNRLDWERRLKTAEVGKNTAALKSAKATRDLRLQELGRLKKLRRSAAFSQARLDDKALEAAQAESAIAEAEADLLKARADLKLAEIDLYNATVRAPYSGVVAKRHTEVGSYLNVGAPVVTLIDDEHLEIEAEVPATRIDKLVPGSPVSFRINGTSWMEATVRAVVPEENSLTRTRTVRFTPNFNEPTLNLAANQSVTLNLPIGGGETVLSVHKDAVLNRNGKNMVYVVNDSKAHLRPVTLGEAVGGRFVVEGGLAEGDLAVVRGNERLRPEQKVKIREQVGQ